MPAGQSPFGPFEGILIVVVAGIVIDEGPAGEKSLVEAGGTEEQRFRSRQISALPGVEGKLNQDFGVSRIELIGETPGWKGIAPGLVEKFRLESVGPGVEGIEA